MDEKELKIKRAEELNNSRPLDVHKWSGFKEVNKAVDEIYEKVKALPAFSGKEKIQKKHIKVVVIDLYDAYLTDPSMYVAYHRSSDAYSMDKRYNALHISKLTPKVVDSLEELGLVENVLGHYDRTGSRLSHISRMRATPKLIEMIVEDYTVKPVMIEQAPDTECIILRERREYIRNGKKTMESVDIGYEDTPETISMRERLTKYNELLRVHHIDIPYLPAGGIPTKSAGKYVRYNPRNKFVRRIFNEDWEHGGRFYGGSWQGISSEWRAKIRIDEMPVIELDYSGLHIVLLYAKEGIDYWEDIGSDPYTLDGHEVSKRMRKLLKEVLLTAINAKDKKSAVAAIRKKVNYREKDLCWVKDEQLDLEKIIDDFAEKHKAIDGYLFSGSGLEMQNLDSKIAEHVVDWFTGMGVPVLVVHDSFIVPYHHKDALEKVMQEAFQVALQEIGYEAKIDPKMKVGTVGGLDWKDVSTDRETYWGAQEKVDPANDPRYVEELEEHRDHFKQYRKREL